MSGSPFAGKDAGDEPVRTLNAALRRWMSFRGGMRYAAAGILAMLALAVAGMTPVHTEAQSPMVIPGCGGSNGSAGVLPAELPVRNGAAAAPPPITAQAAVVVDGATGRVLFEHNANERRAPASVTKIMTAILALETVSEENWTVSSTDATKMRGSSVMGLRTGMYIKMRELLYGLMLPSGNDAAVEIAKNVDGYESEFVERMNRKVDELGLSNTHFMNPHGLDHRRHYSSAYDMAMIGRYAMQNDRFREIAGTRSYRLAPPIDYDLFNGNSLLDTYPDADGIKIGWTNRAGWTLVASAVRDGRRVFVTVLNADDRDGDAAALFDWTFATYTWNQIDPLVTQTLALARRLGLGEPLARSLAVCG